MTDVLLARYREFLPVTDATPLISLGEGDTPLVSSQRIGPSLGCRLYFKLEGCNPTGSFKDRGMVLAVAKALERGYQRIACASTGNTSASAAAYGARYGLETFILVPDGEISAGKLTQAVAYGARILSIKGNFDVALKLIREIVSRSKVALVNSINPDRIDGQKTAALEIIEQLGDAPDIHCLPVGNAGNITAYWKGYKEAFTLEMSSKLPRMLGFQALGAAPIVHGHTVENPQTFATAIRIGNPANKETALKARDESNGSIDAVSDDEIAEAYFVLSREEGLFCEPASAASVAGLIKTHSLGSSLKGKTVVCVMTGSGLKDLDAVERLASVNLPQLAPDLDSLLSVFEANV